MPVQDTVDIVVLSVACEAIVQLWRTAAPLQGVREWIVRYTPFLYSQRQETHLLDCGYCVSLWTAFILFAGYSFLLTPTMYFAYALVIHRISNFTHLVFSLIRDVQLDKRVARNV